MKSVFKYCLPPTQLGRAWCVFAAMLVACSDKIEQAPATAIVDSGAGASKVSTVISPDTAARTLANAAGPDGYRVDEGAVAHGSLSGEVQLRGAFPKDTTVTPDRDSTGCRAFDDVTFPRSRANSTGTGDSATHAMGNAVVWLVGVTHGPRDGGPRRVSMVLDGCHLEPRVMVAPAGATIIASNRDEMLVNLRLVDYGREAAAPRALIGFTDPGQVVPTSVALAKPGLVAVTDDRHAWVRGFIAVAPHPFVAVTSSDGTFVFDGVPVGSYQLVTWHERLGARVMPVRVELGVATVVQVRY